MPKQKFAHCHAKKSRNMARDRDALKNLINQGGTPMVLWECEPKSWKEYELEAVLAAFPGSRRQGACLRRLCLIRAMTHA